MLTPINIIVVEDSFEEGHYWRSAKTGLGRRGAALEGSMDSRTSLFPLGLLPLSNSRSLFSRLQYSRLLVW